MYLIILFAINFLCSICSKPIHIYPINSNLPPQLKVLFISRYELVHTTKAQIREQIEKLYSNMYKQLFDIFDYQDAKWNQLVLHRIEYLKQMNQIKTRMMELDETKRISKELIKIFQEHEHQNHEKYRQNVYQYRSTISPAARPISVASSISLNFTSQQQQSANHDSSLTNKSITRESSPHYHVPPPEPDKLMTYEQAMIYAHPSLKDALRLAHRRKMSSKDSVTIDST